MKKIHWFGSERDGDVQTLNSMPESSSIRPVNRFWIDWDGVETTLMDVDRIGFSSACSVDGIHGPPKIEAASATR